MGDQFDLLIKGGLLYDGTLKEPLHADIGIADGRVARMGRLDGTSEAVVLDARGLAVCPGFIDTHSHSDFTIMADPRAEGKLLQGITTEINGNCGMSAAPMGEKVYERRREDLRELGISERWETFEEYFSILEKRGTALNVAFLAGHGNIRGTVVGYGDERPTEKQLSEMSGRLDDALEQGAIGLSTGLIYPPGVYAGTDELIRLSRVLRSRGLVYASHMRSEGDRLEEAIAEVLRIGRDAGVKVHVSHIKTSGERNWEKADRVVSVLRTAADEGVRISCDRYPYVASSTDLDAVLPAWTYDGGNEAELKRLLNPEDRRKIAAEVREQAKGSAYWDKVLVSSVSLEDNGWMEGKTILEISRVRGRDEIETLLDLLVEERLRVGAIFRSMSEANLRKFLSLPFCMIGTDSSARCFDGPTRRGKPHPRGFGTFPRLLGRYVREDGVLPLAEAIHKSTVLAARTFALEGRGSLAPGCFADIVVFDPAEIQDGATFEEPFRRPEGIPYVLVNGVPVVWEGKITGKRPGRVLRRKSA